ncbi:anti-sigma factor [Microbacterium sp. NPDC055903]
MNRDEFDELSAGHALHALSAAEEARFAQALRAHPEWTAIVEDDAATAAALADAAPTVAPPPALRASLLDAIATTPQHAAAADAPKEAPSVEASFDETPLGGRRPLRILFALAACLALLVGIGVGATVLVGQLQRPASVVALEEIENAPDAQQATVELASGATATAHWSASLGDAVLVTDGLDVLDENRTYELWYVRGDTPVSAGVFDAVDGTTTALLDGEMHAGDVIAVTIEAAGGSPDGAPTTDPIVVIPTA